MNIQQFVTDSFKKINNVFPHALIEYQYDEGVDTHYIRVSPPSVYEDDSFVEIGWDIKDTYDKFFESGDICFLTDKSLIQLTAPTKVFYPEANIAPAYNIEVVIREGEIVNRFDTDVEFDWKAPETAIDLELFQSFLELADNTPGNYKYAMAA